MIYRTKNNYNNINKNYGNNNNSGNDDGNRGGRYNFKWSTTGDV